MTAPVVTERVGTWRVWARDPHATSLATWVSTVERLAASAGSLHRSKHADTYRWSRPGGDVYVKIYRRYRRWTALKDWFRPSKAANVLRVSTTLAQMGFSVPEVVANLTFGGPKRNRMFICGTTSLYSVYLNTRGLGLG